MRNFRLAAAAVVIALAAGAIGVTAGMALGEPHATKVAAPATTTAPPAPKVPPECTQAIANADATLAAATRVANELAEHTKVMDDLIASLAGVHNGMTPHKALTYGMTSVNSGRTDRRAFAQARSAYNSIKQACLTK